jgi:ATP-dependent Clp protease, protease subunit
MIKQDTEPSKGLKDYGIIYLSGTIDAGTARSVCEQIIEINVAGAIDHIQMIINSPGGSCTDGFAVIDIMEWSRIPIYTAGIGLIASMGLLVFMAGEKGRRVITPRTSILSHRFTAMSTGNHSQLIAGRKEEDFLHGRIVDHYLQYSGIDTQTTLEETLLRDVDTWLSPEEAKGFGLADIIEPRSARKNYSHR